MPGLHFEEFEIGHVFHHTLTRTVTEMDNMLFSNMTLNPQPLHIDRHFCETHTEWGQPLVNSIFTLGLMRAYVGDMEGARVKLEQAIGMYPAEAEDIVQEVESALEKVKGI